MWGEGKPGQGLVRVEKRMPKKFGSGKGIKELEARNPCEGRVQQRMGVQWWNRGNIHMGYEWGTW